MVENVGNGENAAYQHFLLFPKCFQQPFFFRVLKNQGLFRKGSISDPRVIKASLTLHQTTRFQSCSKFKTEDKNKTDSNDKNYPEKERKHSEKMRECLLPALSPFTTMFL